ncbi:MAG: uracil-DNA glycosylase [Defluviitaleaceae bacterium]|nr:uracil-DNA glycosylase [Defluviitaleaceae bacterium]
MVKLQNDWDDLLKDEFQKEYYQQLRGFLKTEYQNATIYPSMHDIFNALKLTSYEALKVVIVGQDPYINPGEAHGLAFSVQPGARTPPSLSNIFKEMESDIQCYMPDNGHLVHWAKQGVLLLNTVLTVRRGASKSHAGKGWEQFTDKVLELINKKDSPVVFLLWGRDAQRKGLLVDNPMHLILPAAHPSPLAGGRFFGCKHFSQTNEFLHKNGLGIIDWQIPNLR